MRNQAAMVGVGDVRDKELLSYLAAAKDEPIQPGSVIDESLSKPGNLGASSWFTVASTCSFLLPGKILALMMHFAGCVLRGEQECLGVPIENS